jgi:putative chitinase
MTISLEFLMKATGCTNQVDAKKYLPFIQATAEKYEINTHQRISGFLSQMGVESGSLSLVEENLNYKVSTILTSFGRHRISEADARKYGRNDAIEQKADQEMLANLLYGGEFGKKTLGNTDPGDGWKFRGRGLKQLTGRNNYQRCGNDIDIDLIANPKYILTPKGAADSAGWFWGDKDLNAIADTKDVKAMTKRINGGDHGLAQREALFKVAMDFSQMENVV